MTLWCSLSLLLLPVGAQAQLEPIPTTPEKAFLLPSAVLHEDRSVWVHLPADYDATTNTYPVLYVLDGDAHFKYVAELVDYLSDYDRNRIPPHRRGHPQRGTRPGPNAATLRFPDCGSHP
ncbi:MAG: alpha/beta hydrolase-fold protein [Hymenobacter sp.]